VPICRYFRRGAGRNTRRHPARLSPGGPKTAEMSEIRCLACHRKRLFARSSTSLPRRAHGDEAWTSARERPETPCEIISAGSLLCQTQGVTPRSGSTHGRSGVDRAVRRCRSRSTRGGHARSMSGRALVGTQVCEIGGTGSTAGTPSAAGFEVNPTVLSPFGLRVGRDRVHPRQLAVVPALREGRLPRLTSGSASLKGSARRRRANARRPRSTTREGPLPRAFSSFH
jgi:hypothetical protein